MAVLLAGLPTSVPGRDGQPPVRLLAGRRDAGEPGGRDRRRVARARRRRRVDVARAVGPAQAGARASRPAHQTLHSTTLGWRMVNPQMPEQWTISLGASARRSSPGIHGIDREAQDAFARAQPPARGRRPGTTASTTTGSSPVPGVELARDEGIRADSSRREARPSSSRRSSRTARSPRATPRRSTTAPRAVLIGDEAAGELLGREPLARIAGRGAHGVDPDVFGIGPVEAANRALARAGIGWGDVAAVELNEAFAAQSLACLRRVAGARPRDRQRARRRDRHRPPARRVRRAHPRHARARAAPPRRRLRASRRSASASARASRWCSMPERPRPRRHPPLDYPPYKSTGLRHPKQPLVYLPHTRTETTGPVFGDLRCGRDRPRPHAPARRRAARRAHHGLRPAARRRRPPDPRHARGGLAGQRRRALRHRWDRWPAPLDPNFTGGGRCGDRRRGPLRVRHDQARPVPVGQPRERLAAGAHPLLLLGARSTSGW